MWRVACLCAAAERTPSTALHPQSQHLPASHLRLKGRLLCKTRSAPSAPSSHSSIKGGASPLSKGCQPELLINHSLLGLDANIVMLHRWEHHCAVCDSNVSQRTAEHKCQDAHRQRCAGDTGGSTQQRGAQWCPSCGRACAGLAPGSLGCRRPQATCTGLGKMHSMSSAGTEAPPHLHNAHCAGVLAAADNSSACCRTAALDIRTGVSAARAVHLGQKKALWTICRQVQQACSAAAASLCCRQPAATASLSAVRP